MFYTADEKRILIDRTAESGALNISKGETERVKAAPGWERGESVETKLYRDTALAGRTPSGVEHVPAQILRMIGLYEYGNGSFRQKCRNFYVQGMFMRDYTDDCPWPDKYGRYFCTYHDLRTPVLRGYFSWRSRVRRRQYVYAPDSLAYMYVYELLCGICESGSAGREEIREADAVACTGSDSGRYEGTGGEDRSSSGGRYGGASVENRPADNGRYGSASENRPADIEQRLRLIREFEKGYIDGGAGNDEMRKNLRRWMRDLAVIYGVSAEIAVKCADREMISRDMALAALRSPDDRSDEEIFNAIRTFYGDRIDSSPVVKSHTRGISLFAAVWRYAAERLTVSEKDLFSACFGELKAYPWHPLSNAVYWDGDHRVRDAVYVLDECRTYTCSEGVWQEERYEPLNFDRALFNSLIREADRQLRYYLGTGHELLPDEKGVWSRDCIAAAIEADRRALIEARKPRIDFSGLGRIRADAAITRDSLLVEENIGQEKGTGSAGADNETHGCEPAEEPGAVHGASRGALPEESGAAHGASRGAMPEESGEAHDASRGALPEESGAAHDASREAQPDLGLDELHLDILRMLLAGEKTDSVIAERRLMPQIIADTINEALLDEIGDCVVFCEDDRLCLIEDYRGELERLTGAGNGA